MKTLIAIVALMILMLSGYAHIKGQILNEKVQALTHRQARMESLMNTH